MTKMLTMDPLKKIALSILNPSKRQSRAYLVSHCRNYIFLISKVEETVSRTTTSDFIDIPFADIFASCHNRRAIGSHAKWHGASYLRTLSSCMNEKAHVVISYHPGLIALASHIAACIKHLQRGYCRSFSRRREGDHASG